MTSLGVTKLIISAGVMSTVLQKTILGGTGLALRTPIDYFNKSVDMETRKYSAIRTAIDMTIGTISGIAARYIGEKCAGKMVKYLGETIPEAIRNNPAELAEFTKRAGNVSAIIAAVASIFLIDVPFINKFLNVVSEKYLKKPDNTSKEKQVNYHG